MLYSVGGGYMQETEPSETVEFNSPNDSHESGKVLAARNSLCGLGPTIAEYG